MKVFIDRATLKDHLPTSMLDEFLRAPECEFVTTQLNGQDRVILGEQRDDIQLAEILRENSYTKTGVWPLHVWENFAANPPLQNEESLPPGPWTGERYRLERYLLARIAHQDDADLYVTDDKFLLDFTPRGILGINTVSSEEAIALIGAHLRNRHNFLVRWTQDGFFKSSLDRGFFYLIARSLIFDISALRPSVANEESSSTLGKLSAAIMHRGGQLLKARDFTLFQLLQPHDNQTTDDALYHFDTYLLVMGGIFDLLAQIVDVVLDIRSQSQEVNWHRRDWTRRLREHDAVLAAMVDPPNPHSLTLRLHSILRNTIHGSQLDALHYTNSSSPTEGLISLPSEHKREVQYLLNSTGGPEKWGVVESHDEELWIRPGDLMENLLKACCALVNGVVDHLQKELGSVPPHKGDWEFPFDTETKLRVKYLAGLADVVL